MVDSTYNTCWVTSVGFAENEEDNSVELFPNPATTMLTVSNHDDQIISVYNLIGQRQEAMVSEDVLDVSHLPNGIYFLQVGKETKKFVISR